MDTSSIIKARIQSLIATEAEWLVADNTVLDGETIYVRFGNFVNIKVGIPGNKKFSELKYNLDKPAQPRGSLMKADTPGAPSEPRFWFAGEKGVYPNAGNVNVTGDLGIIIDNGLSYSVANLSIDLTTYLKKADVYTPILSKNRFNKADLVQDFYINSSSGELVTASGSKISNWIPITGGQNYYISGRSVSSLRFKDANGTIMVGNKPDGTPRPDYDLGSGPNGILYAPAASTNVQLTVSLSGGGDLNIIQLELGNVATAYVPYSIVNAFKRELIDPLGYAKAVEVATALADGLAPKLDSNTILERVNLFNSAATVDGYYINSNSGELAGDATSSISNLIPVIGGQVYFVSGKTTTQTEIVFYDSTSTKLKPYNVGGGVRAQFTMDTPNGAIQAPPTAVSVQFTWKFVGTGVSSSVMFSKSSALQPYKPYSFMAIKSILLPTTPGTTTKTFSISKDAGNVYVRCSFDSLNDIMIRLSNSGYPNSLFSPVEAKLLLKSDADTATGIMLHGVGSDDAGPSFFNGTILGGNHGGPSWNITKVGHGKTLADVGAIYTDANSNQFVLFKVVSADLLVFLPKNISTTDTWSFPIPNSPLNYTNSGASTSNIAFTSSISEQLYPSVKNVAQNLIIDGVLQSANSTYQGDKVSLIETYDIIDFADMVLKINSQRPSSGYPVQPSPTVGNSIISIENVFNIQKKCTIAIVSKWAVNKTLLLDRFFGITQNGLTIPSWATSFLRYFPKTLPIINNGTTFDFRLKPEFNTPVITGYIGFDSSVWESGKAPNRVVDIMQSSSLNVNFNLGYIPKLGGDREDLVNNAWEMTSSKKLYPRYLDGKIGTGNVVTAGTVKQGVAFRGWSKPNGIRTNDFLVENGGKYYLFLDYHTTGRDFFPLPTELLGKSIVVLDKSSNVTINSIIITSGIDLTISANTPNYGYCELLIS